jgi:para-aminobenzoate synthetase component 1
MRKSVSFTINNLDEFKFKLIQKLKEHSLFCMLDSNPGCCSEKYMQYGEYDLLVAVEALNHICINEKGDVVQLKHFSDTVNDWLFGHFTYDVKNYTEKLATKNPCIIEFPNINFFQPRYVIAIKGNSGQILYIPDTNTENEALAFINSIHSLHVENNEFENVVSCKCIQTKNDYISSVNEIQKHIHRGNIYEVNYCIQFYAEQPNIEPFQLYNKLNSLSPAPYSAFYRLEDKYLVCSSPERFLRKSGSTVISQPIKGTVRRGISVIEDDKLADDLRNNSKERTENIMITDLVRNDLSRVAIPGSVHVEELCEVYAFKQVNQMVSTISAEVDKEKHWVDIVLSAFPMGSMTGAPKLNAMKLIDGFEQSGRGLYSGSVGYVTPDKNFDFNVVIRSILFNESKKYVSFHVGSAITANCEPDLEYDECLLKAKALLQALNCTNNFDK